MIRTCALVNRNSHTSSPVGVIEECCWLCGCAYRPLRSHTLIHQSAESRRQRQFSPLCSGFSSPQISRPTSRLTHLLSFIKFCSILRHFTTFITVALFGACQFEKANEWTNEKSFFVSASQAVFYFMAEVLKLEMTYQASDSTRISTRSIGNVILQEIGCVIDTLPRKSRIPCGILLRWEWEWDERERSNRFPTILLCFPLAGSAWCMVWLGVRFTCRNSVWCCGRFHWYRCQLDDRFEIGHLSGSILAESWTMLLVIEWDDIRQWQLLAMVYMARSDWQFTRRHRRQHYIILFLHGMGIILCLLECIAGANVCTVRMRFRYTGNQDDSIRIHYSRLFGQMDVASEVGRSHVVCVGRTVSWQRGANGSHCQLHR